MSRIVVSRPADICVECCAGKWLCGPGTGGSDVGIDDVPPSDLVPLLEGDPAETFRQLGGAATTFPLIDVRVAAGSVLPAF